MTDVIDFHARRWAETESTDAHTPIAALREAIREIESGEWPCDHVIIAMGRVTEGTADSQWLQAGSFDVFGQRGLLETIKLHMTIEGVRP